MSYDIAYIIVESGKGGDGLVHFRREKYVPRGGPDGGDGGNGGNIYIIGDESLSSLLHFKRKRHFKAGDGENGKPKKMKGKNGKDVYIKVPIGTVIYNADTNEKIGEILYHNQKILVAKGGKGGRGNAKFATPENRAPQIAEKGEEGIKMKLKLELKTIADVGIVGFPNAGKSTLLNSLTNAHSKVADYPFTTIIPNLGVFIDDIYNRIKIVDIPGIIEGASEGKGLGIQFLRHIERVKALIFLLDPTQSDIIEQFYKLKFEIEKYNPQILKKPYLIVVNKIDLIDSESLPDNIENKEVIKISAKEKINLEKLIIKLQEILKN
ncbi:MAG: GTPase ObgE [candidate division WOR-3 bacterium]